MTPVTRVEVELTERCNLRCKFCYNSCTPVTCERPFDILDAVAASGALELILTGGEPSLHPEFFKILEHARTLFPRVMVQSNGTSFADPKVFDRLASMRPFCLNFSLHGPEAAHDGLTTIPGSFTRTVRALALAVKANIRTASNLVLTAANAETNLLRETVAILDQIGVREMTLTRFIPCGLGRDAVSLATPISQFTLALRTLLDATKARDMFLLLGNATPACLLPEDLRDLCNRCSFGFDKFYVDVHGNVLTCGMSRQVLGNLLVAPMTELLAASPLRQAYLDNRHLPEGCQQCPDLSLCGGGCRAAALAGGGSLSAKDLLSFTPAN